MSDGGGDRPTERDPRVVGILLAGDATALALFVIAGEVSHGVSPIGRPERVVGTLLPFLLGWVVVATAAGLFSGPRASAGRTLFRRGIPAWALAVAIAMGLRSTALFPGSAALSFALVSFGVGGTALLGWRLLSTVLLADTAGGGPDPDA